MFSNMWDKVKELVRRMLGYSTIEQALQIKPAISSKMQDAIELWSQLYEDTAPWLHEPNPGDPSMVVSLGLPAFIASEKARMAVLELQSEITAPKEIKEDENPNYFPPTTDMFGNVKVSNQPRTIIVEEEIGTTERARYMNEIYQDKLLSQIRTQLEYGIAKGSLIIKPYVRKMSMQDIAGITQDNVDKIDKYTIDFDFVQADCFYPLAFDSSHNITEVAFLQIKYDKDKVFYRIEHHKLVGSKVEINNRAFENSNTNVYNLNNISLGKEIPLNSVYEWKDIPKNATIHNVDRLLLGYFKMPEANTVDPRSPLGMSGFGRATTLIREADKQYSRLLWEFEGGELAIDIDRDALQFMKDDNGNGGSVMGHGQQRLYRTIDLGQSDTYKPFSPALRDNSLINGLNNILMRIEDVCALSRGTISNVASEARTATELKILKQRSYSSNCEIQKALEHALRDTIYAMNVYCTLYDIVGDATKDDNGKVDTSKLGKYDVSFTWDDSIIVDVDTELNKRLSLLNAGISSKEELRMWYFGESRAQARTALEKVSEEGQQAIERNMAVSSQMGQAIQQGKSVPRQAQNSNGTPMNDNQDEQNENQMSDNNS